VSIASIRGANRDYIVGAIPHIHKMLTTDFQEFLEHSQTIVIGNQSPLFRGLLKKSRGDRGLIDLVNLMSRRGRRTALVVNCGPKPPEVAQAVSA
jgi:GDP-mannose 6-dehydrogenase